MLRLVVVGFDETAPLVGHVGFASVVEQVTPASAITCAARIQRVFLFSSELGNEGRSD